jgi:two-component system, NarL family, sensor histidine kinase UhpB
MKEKILIIDDEPEILENLETILFDEGFEVVKASSGNEAVANFEAGSFGLVITDMKMPGLSGIDVLRRVKQIDKNVEVIILTGFGTMENAIQALRDRCVYDYLRKPLEDIEELTTSIRNALERRRLRIENEKLVTELRESEEKYRSLVESTKDSIYLIDENLRYLFVNQKHLSRFSLPTDRIIGRKYEEFHSKEESKGFAERIQKVFENGKSLSYEYQSEKDGRYFIRTLSPVKEKDGRIMSVTVISKDITERKQAEKALQISTENLLEGYNQRKILSKRLIDLLEKDRHYIAMELHDNIGQILTALKINLEIIDDKLKPTDTELGSLIKTARKRARQAIDDLNIIAHGLMPGILDALGLVSSIRTLLDEFKEHTGLKIDFFNRNVRKRFDLEKELAIYRIVQEALNNIIKHAKAKHVYVSLLKKDNVLFLSVEDDGVGFDQDKAMKISKGKGPLGLVIMQERAMQLDGELTIESKMGKGTHLLAEIPI